MAYKMKGWSGFQSPLKQETIKRGRKRHLRNLERNKSGRDATVKMEWSEGENEKGKKRYYASPSITFKGDEDELKDPVRDQTFDEALDKGEVYEFKSKRRAKKFAAGSWKPRKAKSIDEETGEEITYRPRREAMRDYRKKKRAIKRNFSKVRPLYFDMD